MGANIHRLLKSESKQTAKLLFLGIQIRLLALQFSENWRHTTTQKISDWEGRPPTISDELLRQKFHEMYGESLARRKVCDDLHIALERRTIKKKEESKRPAEGCMESKSEADRGTSWDTEWATFFWLCFYLQFNRIYRPQTLFASSNVDLDLNLKAKLSKVGIVHYHKFYSIKFSIYVMLPFIWCYCSRSSSFMIFLRVVMLFFHFLSLSLSHPLS